MSQTLSVALGARAYDIMIGPALLERAGQILAPHLNRQRVFVVTDETVNAAHGARLIAGLGAEGVTADVIALPPGEQSKSFVMLETLIDRLLTGGIDRRDLILAFGGGVIGDLAGLAAGLVKRGCAYAQIPTSLLAQVDSAVGGKTAVNVARGKNLVGLFHQPVMVVADTDALATLPARQLRAGYAEIVKYGALGDADFFAWLEANGENVIAGAASARIEAIRRACAMKAAIVARDETETGERALLNLGHTFAHAIESVYGYSDLVLHGEAVAVGLRQAARFSAALGHCDSDVVDRLEAVLARAGLATNASALGDQRTIRVDDAIAAMRLDKKSVSGRMTFILLRAIGAAFISTAIEESAVRAFLASEPGFTL